MPATPLRPLPASGRRCARSELCAAGDAGGQKLTGHFAGYTRPLGTPTNRVFAEGNRDGLDLTALEDGAASRQNQAPVAGRIRTSASWQPPARDAGSALARACHPSQGAGAARQSVRLRQRALAEARLKPALPAIASRRSHVLAVRRSMVRFMVAKRHRCRLDRNQIKQAR